MEGGKGNHTKPSEVPQDQLAAGIMVEMEHTDDPGVARQVAIDHLAEPGEKHKRYYDILSKSGLAEELERKAQARAQFEVQGGRDVGWGVDTVGFSPFYCRTWEECHQEAAIRKLPLYRIKVWSGLQYADRYKGFHSWKNYR